MLDLETALSIFNSLEARRYEAEPGGMDGSEPLFDVRLDAVCGRDEERVFRVRVTTGALSRVTAETWQLVLDEAARHELTVDVQNGGLELTY